MAVIRAKQNLAVAIPVEVISAQAAQHTRRVSPERFAAGIVERHVPVMIGRRQVDLAVDQGVVQAADRIAAREVIAPHFLAGLVQRNQLPLVVAGNHQRALGKTNHRGPRWIARLLVRASP